jgi:hypothetical protein
MNKFASDPIAGAIRSVLSPDLLKPIYLEPDPDKLAANPARGHCYIASEAYYHLRGGKAAGFKAMNVYHEGASHWWVRGPDGENFDLTADQFKTPVPYEKGRYVGFLTRQPSKRAQIVIDRVRARYPGLA